MGKELSILLYRLKTSLTLESRAEVMYLGPWAWLAQRVCKLGYVVDVGQQPRPATACHSRFSLRQQLGGPLRLLGSFRRVTDWLPANSDRGQRLAATQNNRVPICLLMFPRADPWLEQPIHPRQATSHQQQQAKAEARTGSAVVGYRGVEVRSRTRSSKLE